jgi:hypothetical protein
VFVPLAWLIAGPLNPGGYFAFQVWGSEFDLSYWIVSVAIPLGLGCAGSLFFLRGGGFGFLTLGLITILVTVAACSMTGPIYTMSLWWLGQFGIVLTPFPIWDVESALRTSGTFIRIGFMMLAVPIVPAIIVLRLLAFQRETKRR